MFGPEPQNPSQVCAGTILRSVIVLITGRGAQMPVVGDRIATLAAGRRRYACCLADGVSGRRINGPRRPNLPRLSSSRNWAFLPLAQGASLLVKSSRSYLRIERLQRPQAGRCFVYRPALTLRSASPATAEPPRRRA